MSSKKIFEEIYSTNMWKNAESRSGPGSTMKATTILRERLPIILKMLDIKSILDIPCGDLNFMQHIDLGGINYIGADIVDDMIEANKTTFSNRPNMSFVTLDAINDQLPKVDIIFTRDMIIHFPNDEIFKFLENARRSGSTWLLTSHYVGDLQEKSVNEDIKFGYFRPVNLTLAPFNFPKPLLFIPEMESNKNLGMWKIN